MYAKVVTVQLVNMLGYHLLFQDVDIVWYRDPLPALRQPPFSDFDVVFQDDGAHTLRYAPYSANSGFYYVRHNAKTRYLFAEFLYNGELILQKKSHQQALTALLGEHASRHGLKVKIIPMEDLDFLGGFHYHRKIDTMRALAKDEVKPSMFHMSWTSNKKNKLLFMKQMGMWYVNGSCVDKNVTDITSGSLVADCCAAKPIVTCHYRDKASIVSCEDSPAIDKGKPSFW